VFFEFLFFFYSLLIYYILLECEPVHCCWSIHNNNNNNNKRCECVCVSTNIANDREGESYRVNSAWVWARAKMGRRAHAQQYWATRHRLTQGRVDPQSGARSTTDPWAASRCTARSGCHPPPPSRWVKKKIAPHYAPLCTVGAKFVFYRRVSLRSHYASFSLLR